MYLEIFGNIQFDKFKPKIDENVPKFCETIQQFYAHCWQIGMEILRVLAINLGLSVSFAQFFTIIIFHFEGNIF